MRSDGLSPTLHTQWWSCHPLADKHTQRFSSTFIPAGCNGSKRQGRGHAKKTPHKFLLCTPETIVTAETQDFISTVPILNVEDGWFWIHDVMKWLKVHCATQCAPFLSAIQKTLDYLKSYRKKMLKTMLKMIAFARQTKIQPIEKVNWFLTLLEDLNCQTKHVANMQGK